MPIFWLLLIVVAISAVGFVFGRRRALESVGHDGRELHSLPVYYGANAFMKAIVPAAGLILVWLLAQPLFIDNRVSQMIPESEIREGSSRGLVMSEVRRTAEGLENAVRAGVLDDDTARNARADFTDMTTRLKEAGQVVTNQLTQPVLLEWAPSYSGRGGASSLGIIPLLWGTFYISLVALLVAVPIGLFAAIYLSEYASPRVRGIAKPLLEILAGIPTIVYGLFALLTIGPLLLSVFGDDTGLGWMQGQRAVLTAGIAMGIMLIPFVSSLSDDIINAVPQAMRDGAYGLCATRSVTIKQVVLPAALPGFVGAILLAASRAIGETMIVVLGAGAAARLSLNPFEAMTTVTAKIVSQLTGDSDFASPEALVAFALGMTLFLMTLCLNVFALYIVRKYREQYD